MGLPDTQNNMIISKTIWSLLVSATIPWIALGIRSPKVKCYVKNTIKDLVDLIGKKEALFGPECTALIA